MSTGSDMNNCFEVGSEKEKTSILNKTDVTGMNKIR